MTKSEFYKKEVADIEHQIEMLNARRKRLDDFLKKDPPDFKYNIGDFVELETMRGRKIKGEILRLGILQDKLINVTALKVKGKVIYLTAPSIITKKITHEESI